MSCVGGVSVCLLCNLKYSAAIFFFFRQRTMPNGQTVCNVVCNVVCSMRLSYCEYISACLDMRCVEQSCGSKRVKHDDRACVTVG